LITLIHEISHLVAFEKFGRNIKPHGNEWKYSFQRLMIPYIRPEIFPSQLLPLLARHFKTNGQ
jgi:predicted SprT family Zn-dependent metalloprotease